MVEVRLRIPFFSTKARRTGPARRCWPAPSEPAPPSTTGGGLAIALGDLGAELSVGADADRLLLSASGIAAGLPALLGLYAEILTSASYPNAEVGGERGRLLERITMSRSQAGVMAGEALADRMAPGHPYGRTLPDAQEVAATTAAQLRSPARRDGPSGRRPAGDRRRRLPGPGAGRRRVRAGRLDRRRAGRPR